MAVPFTIHANYNRWYLVDRPTNEELRHDLRAILETRSDYRYEAYTTPGVQQIRIPQREWANGLPVAKCVVRRFDLNAGIGMIARDGSGEKVFFHFIALPGQGYRTIKPEVPAQFEVVEGRIGPIARNIQ
jgi:cold shock CspA family protein